MLEGQRGLPAFDRPAGLTPSFYSLRAVVLAALSSTAAWIVIGSYLGLCLLIYLAKRRDIYGRKRATGCAVGLVMFFGLILIAFAAWAADNIF